MPASVSPPSDVTTCPLGVQASARSSSTVIAGSCTAPLSPFSQRLNQAVVASRSGWLYMCL